MDIDHAVVLVAYGGDGDNKYWTIKNSWGPTWGVPWHWTLDPARAPNGLGTSAAPKGLDVFSCAPCVPWNVCPGEPGELSTGHEHRERDCFQVSPPAMAVHFLGWAGGNGRTRRSDGKGGDSLRELPA